MTSRLLLSTAGTLALAVAAVSLQNAANADPLVFGSSPAGIVDLGGLSNGPFNMSGGPWSTSANLAGTADFGSVFLTTNTGVGGVYDIVFGGAQSLTVTLPSSTLTGTIQWADIANGTAHMHMDGTYTYTDPGDPTFGTSGAVPIDLISDELPGGLTLETWAGNDLVISFSAGDAGGPAGVPEPSTLAVFGAFLIAAGFYYQGRNRNAGTAT